MRTPRRAEIAVAVWDESFVDKFADLSLETQLSAGNLPALAKHCDIAYHLLTTRASHEHVVARTRELAGAVPLSVRLLEETVVDGVVLAEAVERLEPELAKHQINRLTAFWLIDRCLSQPKTPIAFMLDSDFLFSDGAFVRCVEMIDEGANVVAIPALRLSQERSGLGAAPLFASPEARATGLSRDVLVAGMMLGLHHTSEVFVTTAKNFSSYPAAILWPVAGKGFLCRTVFPHPLAFLPTERCRRFHSTIDYEFALRAWPGEGDVRLPGRPDDLVVCKVSSDELKPRQGTERPLSVSLLAQFLLKSTNRAHRALAEQPVYLTTGEATENERGLAARMTGEFLADAYGIADRLVEALSQGGDLERLIARSHAGPLDEYLSPGRVSGDLLRVLHSRS